MRARQYWALIGCILANVVDGFDVLAVAFTGSALMKAWQLSPATLGMIFSAGLIGMALGSLFISPLADRHGRRMVSLACMAVMAIGMLASGLATSAPQLIALRLLTGLGIGGVLATLNTVVAETAPPARRNLILAIFSAGYPIGSIIGGALSVQLIASHGWQIIYFIGGGLTALVLLINVFALPESGRPSGRVALNFGFLRRLCEAAGRGPTIAICAAFFLNMLSFFFILNWTPKLMEMIGLSQEEGNRTVTIINIGSLLGPLIFGYLADRLGLIRMARLYFSGFALAIAAFAFIPGQATAVLVLSMLIGLCMAGAMTSLYASAPVLFPAEVRAGGTGIAIGLGRLGGALGPFLAGQALAIGLSRPILYLVFALPPLIVVALLWGPWFERVQSRGSQEI